MQTEIIQLVDNMTIIFKSFHNRACHKVNDKHFYPEQPRLLGIIQHHEGITQKELAEKSHVTPATITGMLNKLESNHYVYREPDETDKRIMRVYLTPEGHHFAEIGAAFMQKSIERIFDGFTEEELHTLVILSEKMKENVLKGIRK